MISGRMTDMDIRSKIDFLSETVDLMAKAESTREANQLANHLINAVNHTRNSRIYELEGNTDRFKEVQVRSIQENKSLHVNWLITALDNYKGLNRTVDSALTIGEFIEQNCAGPLGINLNEEAS
jgi:hypothetical protein